MGRSLDIPPGFRRDWQSSTSGPVRELPCRITSPALQTGGSVAGPMPTARSPIRTGEMSAGARSSATGGSTLAQPVATGQAPQVMAARRR